MACHGLSDDSKEGALRRPFPCRANGGSMSYATFEQRTGRFTIWEVEDGGSTRVLYECVGYSGRIGRCRNNPSCEGLMGVGPIPAGNYHIGRPYHSPRVGPLTFPLVPIDHDAHGRSAFRIHGDSRDGDASRGCIVLGRPHREAVVHYAPRRLDVVPDSSAAGGD